MLRVVQLGLESNQFSATVVRVGFCEYSMIFATLTSIPQCHHKYYDCLQNIRRL